MLNHNLNPTPYSAISESCCSPTSSSPWIHVITCTHVQLWNIPLACLLMAGRRWWQPTTCNLSQIGTRLASNIFICSLYVCVFLLHSHYHSHGALILKQSLNSRVTSRSNNWNANQWLSAGKKGTTGSWPIQKVEMLLVSPFLSSQIATLMLSLHLLQWYGWLCCELLLSPATFIPCVWKDRLKKTKCRQPHKGMLLTWLFHTMQ